MALKSRGLLLVSLALVLSIWQNCTRTSSVLFTGDFVKKLSASESGTGQPYDGKIYVLTGDPCADQSNIQAEIILKNAVSAVLLRDQCQWITPVLLTAADFQLNPSNPDELQFRQQTFSAEHPTGTVIGTKIDVSLATMEEPGYAYIIRQGFGTPGDYKTNMTISKLRLYENGIPLGPAHTVHVDIRDIGYGRFSHFEGSDPPTYLPDDQALRFSSSDNSDPRTNGRIYSYDVGP